MMFVRRLWADDRAATHPKTEITMTKIGASLLINGDISSSEDMTIEGQVVGSISMQDGELLVAPSANVRADAQAKRLKIQGTFAGDIAASERVELATTANVQGTLLAPAIVVQDGAVFNGSIEVAGRTKGAARQSPAA